MSANRISSPTFADLLRQGTADASGRQDDGSRHALRGYARQALVPIAVAGVLGGLWSALAPLAGAIIAPAQLKVELNRKTVQHQEGGIVREILVRDGQKVRAGEALLVIGDVRDDATLQLVRDQLDAERVRRARATAESELAPQIGGAADVPRTGATAELWARERALFAARRRVLDESVAALQAQIRDAQLQVAGLQQRLEATETSARLSAEEVAINEKLVRQGFIQRARMLSLERAEADSRAHVGETRSDLALAKARIGDLQARITQARAQYQSQATDELRDAWNRIRALEERLRPSQDQVARQTVRSPVDGEVMALRVSAPGAVIGPRDPILDVVPERERIVVEARIRPQDIDHVRRDGRADVRLGAFDARDTPLLPGIVTFVSPDRVTGTNGGEWFVATIDIERAALVRHPNLRLHPGMPAEVYVKTPERTVLAYFAKSLHIFANRAMREP